MNVIIIYCFLSVFVLYLSIVFLSLVHLTATSVALLAFDLTLYS
jgi:hypothetical protein